MSAHLEARLPLYLGVSGAGPLSRPDTLASMAAPPRMVFSPSRIGTWIACNRKAGWEYFAGYKSPSTAANDKGTAVHAVLEAQGPAMVAGHPVEIDRTDEIGAIAAEIVPHIPSEAINADTQFEMEFTIQGRHTWKGYVDLRAPGIIIDYKTTSDFKYVKTSDVLDTDPQAVVYARSEFIALPTLETVWQRWIYSRTRGAKQARSVDHRVTRVENLRMFAVMETFADEMQQAADACPPAEDPVATHKYVLTLHGNKERCKDYGGCPHRDRCGIFFDDPNYKDTHHMSPLERLQAMNALNGQGAPAPMLPPPMPAVAPPALLPAGSPADSMFARLAAEAGLRPASMGQAPFPIPAMAVATLVGEKPFDPPQDVIDATVKAAEGINPPPPRKRGRPVKDTIPAPALAMSAVVAEAVTAPTPPIPTTIAPTSSGLAAPAMAAMPNFPKVSEQFDAAKHAAIVPATTAARPAIGTLYVGCMPVGTDARVAATSLSNILLDAREMIGHAAYFGGYGYKTDGMMAEALQKILIAKGHIARLVVEDPRLPEVAKVLSYLRANAAETVEALR